MYGAENNSILDRMIELEIAPKEFRDYRNYFHSTFDIETSEQKLHPEEVVHGLSYEADLKVLSIATGGNFENYKGACWVRKTSHAKHGVELVQNFLNELEKLYDLRQKTLPSYFEKMEEEIEARILKVQSETPATNSAEEILNAAESESDPEISESNKTNFELSELRSFERYLTSYRKLPVFGFNSSKFDLPVLAGTLFNLLEQNGETINCLKKNAAYFSVSTSRYIFKDIMHFTAPCTLDKFLKNWDAPASKSIWPYSRFANIEEIEATLDFPDREDFFSDLTQTECDENTYKQARDEYNRRKSLPTDDPEKINSMKDWLKIYNLLDVAPFSAAIENCFRSYSEHFRVDPMMSYSLPSLAQEAMFANFSPDSPLFFTIPRKEFEDVNDIFRQNVIGGLVNCFARHASTRDSEQYPFRVSHTPNKERIKTLSFLDFNGMYLSVQNKKLPTGPGIVWTKGSGNKWSKRIMTNGHSFVAEQWLTFCQHTDPELKLPSGLVRIECKSFRGEVKFPKSDGSGFWEVDGCATLVSNISYRTYFQTVKISYTCSFLD